MTLVRNAPASGGWGVRHAELKAQRERSSSLQATPSAPASAKSDQPESRSPAELFESMAARVIDCGVEAGLLASAFREPPEDAKVKARYLALMAPHYFGKGKS